MCTNLLPTLSLEAAKVASAAAENKAKQIGVDVNIALVDSTLQLLHFIRMPTAKLTSVQTAIDKAFTAAGHRAPTATYTGNPIFLPGAAGYGVHHSNGGRFVLLAGGVPVFVEGAVVGTIGVGSGTPAQDCEIAEAEVAAVEMWKVEMGEKAEVEPEV